MADIVMFGTGHAAEMMKVYLERESSDRLVGFTVDAEFLSTDSFAGLPVVAWERLEDSFSPDEVKIMGPLTHHRMNQLRRDRQQEAKRRGYELASFIHPGAYVYSDAIGEGCVVLELSVVQPCSKIGDGVVIWSNSVVGHHAILGDYCFLSSQVGVGGRSTIGARCYLGGKAGIAPGVSLGEACAVLNRANVIRDLPANSVVKAPGDKSMAIPSSRIEKLL